MSFDVKEWLDSLLQASPYDLSEERLCELACDDNGYVRESATRALAQSGTPQALAALVERLNDWVPQVRRVAREAVNDYLDPARLPAILGNLPAFLALRSKARADHSALLQQVCALLRTPRLRGQVLASLSVSRGQCARFLFEQLATDESLLPDLLARAAMHADPLVRLQAARTCGAYAADWSTALLQQMLQDRHYAVRREALYLVFPRLEKGPVRKAILQGRLLDPRPAVREWAVWLAQKAGFDLPGFVRAHSDRMQAGQHSPALLGLIRLLRDGAGLEYVRGALCDARPSVRYEAVAAYASLQPEAAAQAVAATLADHSPRLWRLAQRLVRKGEVALSSAQYREAFDSVWKIGCSGRALKIAELMHYWDRLECLLATLPAVSGSQRLEVVSALEAWAGLHVPCRALEDARQESLRGSLAELRNGGLLPEQPELIFAFRTLGLLPEGGTRD